MFPAPTVGTAALLAAGSIDAAVALPAGNVDPVPAGTIGPSAGTPTDPVDGTAVLSADIVDPAPADTIGSSAASPANTVGPVPADTTGPSAAPPVDIVGAFGAAAFADCGCAAFKLVAVGVFGVADVAVGLRAALIAAAARASVSRARAAAVSATHAPTAEASKIGRSAGCCGLRRRLCRSAARPNSGSFSGDGSATEPAAGRAGTRFKGSPGAAASSPFRGPPGDR
jgi:hypothetical protein